MEVIKGKFGTKAEEDTKAPLGEIIAEILEETGVASRTDPDFFIFVSTDEASSFASNMPPADVIMDMEATKIRLLAENT